MRIAGACCCLLVACGFTGANLSAPGATDAAAHDALVVGDGAHPAHDAAIDAHPHLVDAHTFDAADCPSSYTTIGGTGSDTLYRANTSGVNVVYTVAEALCEADRKSGGPQTHVVVFDTEMERVAVVSAVATLIADNYLWTGNYTESATAPWLKITGGSMTDTSNWGTNQPSYQTPAPNMAVLTGVNSQGSGVYQAQPDYNSYNFVCECDGLAETEP